MNFVFHVHTHTNSCIRRIQSDAINAGCMAFTNLFANNDSGSIRVGSHLSIPLPDQRGFIVRCAYEA